MANSSGPSGWFARGTRFVGKPRRWAAIAFGSPSGGSPPRKPNDSGDPCEKSELALFLCFAALLLTAEAAPARADTAWATATYQQAEKLYAAGQYAQALALYEQIIAREPEAKLSFCRAGTAAAGAGQLKKAINYYKSCEQVYPDSLLPRAELVKLYQIAGDIPNRDYERNGLLELHLNTTRQETKAVDHYIRDIFPVGQRSVVAWEYFDLTGDWPTRYRFIVIDESDNALFTVALSSSPQAQANAQAILGHPTKARIFHLDLEQDNIITTLKVFEGEPSYDTVKPLAITAILHGESGKTTP